jgi:uncharacterized membrane protein (DUF4010 family)
MPLGLDPAASGLITAGLIGLLIGVQRESVKTPEQPGARDFLLIGLAGGFCGLLNAPPLTIAVLTAIVAILISFHIRAGQHTGITTELAGVLTFGLSFLASQRDFPGGWGYAVGLAIVAAFFLESRDRLHEILRTQFTGVDFIATLKFLALIFLIYPVLPEGEFGPYNAIQPRLIWKFIILVSSVSFFGYLLQKWMGEERGLRMAALLGGLASTTAATAAFARSSRDDPKQSEALSHATILANAVQFPRIVAIVAALNPDAALHLLPMFGLLAVTALITIWAVSRRRGAQPVVSGVPVSNPMRLKPAILFGFLFATIVFVTRAGQAIWGSQAVLFTSLIGGAIDTDAVVVSVAQLHRNGEAGLETLLWSVFVALLSNAVVKGIIAIAAGTRLFARGVLLGFAAMFGGGALLVWAFARAGFLHLS